MKRLMAGIAFFAVLTGFSQTSPSNAGMQSQIRQGLLNGSDRALLTQRTETANAIRSGRYIYSGVAVQLVKADNRLQLINPAAPPRYGSAWDNVVAHPTATSRNASQQGIKIFSISF